MGREKVHALMQEIRKSRREFLSAKKQKTLSKGVRSRASNKKSKKDQMMDLLSSMPEEQRQQLLKELEGE